MAKITLTAAQALVRYLCAQHVETDDGEVPYFAGVWAIFGHGNVSALGEALYAARDDLVTYRAHNEQSMAHAAIAYAKTMRRRRAMACTTSIGPGATNMVTAAALAHVNRLPVLFLPGDVFAGRRPDPVLQQIENPCDGTVSANDCFRPVSNYFDRVTRPEQLLNALPRAMATLTDPAACGPATLALCQDAQSEAYDYPAEFFERKLWRMRRQQADERELDDLAAALAAAERPLIVAGGGVLYSGADKALATLSQRTGVPVAETQAGKGALAADHGGNLGSIGVTGAEAANAAARDADLVLAIGTRLQDFTTGSRGLFENARQKMFHINVSAYDALKHGAAGVVGDALASLEALAGRLGDYRAPASWTDQCKTRREEWRTARDRAVAAGTATPSDAQVLGAVNRAASDNAIVVCAAGGLPGELHKLWLTGAPGGYHVEYGYSCMGYEIAGGLGVKMAAPDRDVYVMVGDGSYMMANSEIATAVMLGRKLMIVVLDNHGFGCINRLQVATGGAPFNNLFENTVHEAPPQIDFAGHAKSLGAEAEKVADLAALDGALARAKASAGPYVVVIETDPAISTQAGGFWWDVAVPAVSARDEVKAARQQYEDDIVRYREKEEDR